MSKRERENNIEYVLPLDLLECKSTRDVRKGVRGVGVGVFVTIACVENFNYYI